MRVIAGKYKGRKLNSPINNDVRPTTDKVKEAIYNILQGEVEDSYVLDMFAGSGGLGIEAISRGAKKVFFCENNSRALDLLVSNLAFCEKGTYEIFKGDYSDCLRLIASRGIKLDIILCDPPYIKKLGREVLSRVQKHDLLADGGKIVVERKSSDESIEDDYFAKTSQRRYGETTLEIFSKVRKIAVTGTFDPFTKGHKDLIIKALEDFDVAHVVVLDNPDKKVEYSLSDRLKMIELSIADYGDRVVVEYFDGLAVDYCNKNGIKYILRGIRDDRDFVYEREMAKYNLEKGGVETIFMNALSQISSTKVREKVKQSVSVEDMVEENIIPILKQIKD